MKQALMIHYYYAGYIDQAVLVLVGGESLWPEYH